MLYLEGFFSKAVKINLENVESGEIRSIMVGIHYDYVPEYCQECRMQCHNKENCKVRNTRCNDEPIPQ